MPKHNLRAIRQALGLSLREMSDLLGFPAPNHGSKQPLYYAKVDSGSIHLGPDKLYFLELFTTASIGEYLGRIQLSASRLFDLKKQGAAIKAATIQRELEWLETVSY